MSRRWQKRPFGGAVAELAVHPERVTAVHRRWFGGSELGRRIGRVLTWGRLGGEGKREEPRTDRRVQAQMLRVLLCVASEAHPTTRCAAGMRLWQGERDRETAPEGVDPKRHRIAGRRGLAARAGVSTRQLQRYLHAFERAGVLGRRQPHPDDTRARLRGRNHAYVVYQFTSLPRAMAERLLEWRRGRQTSPGLAPVRPVVPTPVEAPGKPPRWEVLLAAMSAQPPPA